MANKMMVKVTRFFRQEVVCDLDAYTESKLFTKEEIENYEVVEADPIEALAEAVNNGDEKVTCVLTQVDFIHSDPDAILQDIDDEDSEEEIGDGDDEYNEVVPNAGSVS